MPTFCRHNRFIQNCPICREPEREPAARARAARAPRRQGTSAARAPGLQVRRAERAADDGYRSSLTPGLRASADAERLAEELAFSAGRLLELAAAPPGLYAAVAREADLEEATWLAFLLAYLSPGDGDGAFDAIAAAHRSWASGEPADLAEVVGGPRTSHHPAQGGETLLAYRAWAERAGSQAAALAGDAGWSPERRFARAYERLALPGLARSARFDFLVALGRLGRYELRAETLELASADPTQVAAKRVFGIADRLLLERRAAELAAAAGVPLEALDLALWNWARTGGGDPRGTLGAGAGVLDEDARHRARAALGL